MTAALTGLPLLALFLACYGALALLVLALCAASKRPEASALIDLRDGDGPCDCHPLCPCRWEAS